MLSSKRETCLGKYSKGQRNDNGDRLIELCEDKKLFISNSAFNHPARHQTTWVGQRKDRSTGNIINIFNQIDDILCQQRHKHLLVNARSYAGTILTSDHKLVKTSLQLEQNRVWRKALCRLKRQEPKVNIANLISNQHREMSNKISTHARLVASKANR
ncbi:craniofacial development protein 2-like [Elysia marginata]|uniref:Craniofacial development protein 2-like n=1 Tax=Elysia marginata TaxID=1093978 RepID=A0AAV4F542_9GAST|nr:craniofacial development protein 2-like [Elysia marginata]